MAPELSQEQVLQQTQTQTQSILPLQYSLMRLLELPVSDLESRVKNEMLENSALEEVQKEENTRSEETNDEDADGNEEANEASSNYESLEQYNEDRRADYLGDDDTPDYLLNTANNDSEYGYLLVKNTETFYDRLIAQIGEYDLTQRQKQIIEYLIGSLDNDGLLRKDLDTISDELAINYYLDASVKEIEECLHTLQTFEPIGIAAQSLQECLLMQLKDPDYHSEWKEIEQVIIEKYFDDFTHKRLTKIKERFKLNDDSVKNVYNDLTHLNPRPGSGLSDSTLERNFQNIIPDFRVYHNDRGELEIMLNNGNVPTLQVSRSFKETIEEYNRNKDNLSREQKETYVYAKQKVEAAQTFITAIKMRNETMLNTMRSIVSMQKDYFEEGDESLLHPMKLRDIAERTGMDISTISRVSNSKYVDTEYGILPLKFFFSNRLTQEGSDVSSLKIKSIIKHLIASEDKENALSDQAITEILKQQGYNIARRTIAKYREELGYPIARLRK